MSHDKGSSITVGELREMLKNLPGTSKVMLTVYDDSRVFKMEGLFDAMLKPDKKINIVRLYAHAEPYVITDPKVLPQDDIDITKNNDD